MKTTAKTKSRKAPPPTWWAKTTTAGALISVLADLDTEDEIDPRDLRYSADRIANALNLSDPERDEFVAAAMVNHPEHGGAND